MDWNDLKLFLTVARLGSIRAAALELGVNQSTVNRRLAVLEHAVKLRLFDATTRGHVLTAQGLALAEAAAPMQAQAEAVAQAAQLLTRRMTGTLKITAPQTLFKEYVAPVIAEFHLTHPDVHLNYDGSERLLDLIAGEADIAFRAADVPPDARFRADKVQDHLWTVYCSTAYAARRGVPGSVADLAGHDVVALGGRIGQRPGNKWFMQQIAAAKVTGIAEGVPNMQQVLLAGLGVGTLPCITGDAEPGLQQCFAPLPELTTALWLVTTAEQGRDPRVQAFVALVLRRMRPPASELSFLTPPMTGASAMTDHPDTPTSIPTRPGTRIPARNRRS